MMTTHLPPVVLAHVVASEFDLPFVHERGSLAACVVHAVRAVATVHEGHFPSCDSAGLPWQQAITAPQYRVCAYALRVDTRVGLSSRKQSSLCMHANMGRARVKNNAPHYFSDAVVV